MLADRRAEALVATSPGSGCSCGTCAPSIPDQNDFPDFDDNLRQAFRRETELFFESVMREDRSVLDLLTADYTFVNERLARHYGIPDVYGSHFRRVRGRATRRGGACSGKGSILLMTSHPDRTSPVVRGKWILDNLLGTPPPPPPADVPALEESAGDGAAHACASRWRAPPEPGVRGCHRLMDPLGFALENFDAVGAWRTRDAGGADRRVGRARRRHGGGRRRRAAAGAARSAPRCSSARMTEKLLTYALGRGLDYYDARWCARSCARRRGRTIGFRRSSWASSKSTPFQMRTNASAGYEGAQPAGRPRRTGTEAANEEYH